MYKRPRCCDKLNDKEWKKFPRWLVHKMPKCHLKIPIELNWLKFYIWRYSSDDPYMCIEIIRENSLKFWQTKISCEIYLSQRNLKKSLWRLTGLDWTHMSSDWTKPRIKLKILVQVEGTPGGHPWSAIPLSK